MDIRNYLLSVESWEDPSNWKPSVGSVGTPGQNGPPEIISAGLASVRQFYKLDYQIIVLNGAQSYSASQLPDGLSLDVTSGRISGSPTVAGEFTIDLGASNTQGSTTGSMTIQVSETLTPEITSSTTASVQQGFTFDYFIIATNGPDVFSATGLPGGLTFNSTTGRISGTPTEIGSYPILLSAMNNAGTGTLVLTLTVAEQPIPEIFVIDEFSVLAGTPLNFPIAASRSPFIYSATGLCGHDG